jgi:hypothetical protein
MSSEYTPLIIEARLFRGIDARKMTCLNDIPAIQIIIISDNH